MEAKREVKAMADGDRQEELMDRIVTEWFGDTATEEGDDG